MTFARLLLDFFVDLLIVLAGLPSRVPAGCAQCPTCQGLRGWHYHDYWGCETCEGRGYVEPAQPTVQGVAA